MCTHVCLFQDFRQKYETNSIWSVIEKHRQQKKTLLVRSDNHYLPDTKEIFSPQRHSILLSINCTCRERSNFSDLKATSQQKCPLPTCLSLSNISNNKTRAAISVESSKCSTHLKVALGYGMVFNLWNGKELKVKSLYLKSITFSPVEM